MNYPLIQRLVLKDWYFNRGPVAGYTAGGLAGLAIVCLGTPWSFYAGTVLLITFVVALGIHLAAVSVVQERTEHTLPFIMSLPISPTEYTVAKMVANLSMFLLPWLTFTATATLILGSEGARSGAVTPFALIVLTYILTSFTLVLSVAIITESLLWTIFTMGVTNLSLQFFLYWVSHLPAIARGMSGYGAVWDRTVIALLAAEMSIAALSICCAFVFQARKRDFL
jgi:ABC-2 type transport system permease protein